MRNESGAWLVHHPRPAPESWRRGLDDPAPESIGVLFEISRPPEQPLLGANVIWHGAGRPGERIARLGQLVQCSRPVLPGACGDTCGVESFHLVDRVGKRWIAGDEAQAARGFPFPA